MEHRVGAALTPGAVKSVLTHPILRTSKRGKMRVWRYTASELMVLAIAGPQGLLSGIGAAMSPLWYTGRSRRWMM
jgi:hypothetical protein